MPHTVVDLSIIAGCLIWVPLTVWILALLGWIIQGEVDPIAGFVGIAIGVGIGAVAWMSPNPNMAPSLLLATISMVILFPYIRSLKERQEHVKIDVELMEKAYDQLAVKPDNVGSKVRIAQTLYQHGSPEQGIALMEITLEKLPKQLFEQEHRTLAQWKRSLPGAQAGTITCIVCRAKNKAGELFCYRCGEPVLLHYARGRWVHPATLRTVLLSWVAAMISIVGIPWAATSMPRERSAPVVIILLAISTLIVWATLKLRKVTA